MNHAQKLALFAGLVLYAILPQFLKSYGVYLMTLLCIYLMAVFGLNLIVGYAGQMSIGQAAFYGIGAYHAAILLKLGWPFFAVLPIAAVACFPIGLALGFPALRVQHHYLACATLGFNVLVYLVMRNEEALTGRTFGISNIPRPSIFGFSLDGSLAFFYLSYASVIILAGAMVAAALSVGPCIRRAARQSYPRGEYGRQHHGVHAARLRDRRRLRRHWRRVSRGAGQLHRAGTVSSLRIAHHAARSDRGRLGPILRSGARLGDRRAAA